MDEVGENDNGWLTVLQMQMVNVMEMTLTLLNTGMIKTHDMKTRRRMNIYSDSSNTLVLVIQQEEQITVTRLYSQMELLCQIVLI